MLNPQAQKEDQRAAPTAQNTEDSLDMLLLSSLGHLCPEAGGALVPLLVGWAVVCR